MRVKENEEGAETEPWKGWRGRGKGGRETEMVLSKNGEKGRIRKTRKGSNYSSSGVDAKSLYPNNQLEYVQHFQLTTTRSNRKHSHSLLPGCMQWYATTQSPCVSYVPQQGGCFFSREVSISLCQPIQRVEEELCRFPLVLLLLCLVRLRH